MDDDSFRQILEFFELSWRGYHKVRKGVKKRLAHHMQQCGCRTIAQYLEHVQEDLTSRQRALELLTVSISRFFRNFQLWAVLERVVLPELIREARVEDCRPVRVWSAGCSCGEEVYSLKILWESLGERLPLLPPLEVWATDSNPEVLEKACRGVFSRSSLKRVPAGQVAGCFMATAGGFAVKERFKGGVRWLRHDFISQAPPGAGFDLIFVRNNLLTYYGPAVHVPVFLRMLHALHTGGFLVIGMNERPPATVVRLEASQECRCLLRKTPACPIPEIPLTFRPSVL